MILQKKQPGDKNPLSAQEIEFYTKALSGQYQIGPQLGQSGSGTSAYLLMDSNGSCFVLKIPNDPTKTQDWIKEQQESIRKKEAYIGDYRGAIFVPKTIQVAPNFVVEELASGKEFSQKVYDSLSQKDKATVAKDFAIFLNHSHQRTFQGMGPALELSKPSLEQIFKYLEPALGLREKMAFFKCQKAFESQKQDPQVLTFGDYRSQNMFWDDNKKQLSIIDFDFTRPASVYREFTPDAASSYHGSYQFLKDVINIYNRLPKRHQIHIDLEKVRTNCMIGIYHEFGRCGINRKLSAEHQMHWLRPLRRALDRAFCAAPAIPTIRRKQNENT